MPESSGRAEVQVVKINDRISLVRVRAPRSQFEIDHEATTAARLVLNVSRENEMPRRFHRLTPSPPGRPEEMTLEFAVPTAALQREAALSIGIGEEKVIDLPHPGASRPRSSAGRPRTRQAGAAVPSAPEPAPPGSKNELIDAQSQRIGALELQVGKLRAQRDQQRTKVRQARRALEETERAWSASRGESEVQIHALTDRCAELEATIKDLLEELRAVSERK